MNNLITRQQVIARLEENQLAYSILSLQANMSVIVSEYGGRIFGPFINDQGSSIFWTQKAFRDSNLFKDFLVSGHWNLGGERIWIAPEIQYNIPDPGDFWGSYSLPQQVDPGKYSLCASHDKFSLSMEIELDAYNLASGKKTLQIERTLQSAENPLRFGTRYNELMKNIKYSGYEHIVSLSESLHDDKVSETWDILQLNPGGQLYIPMSSLADITNYYEPVDSKVCKRYEQYLQLQITGNRRFKIGVNAAGALGRMGYLNQIDSKNAYLLIRNFFNNPSSLYAEEPHEQRGVRGNSVHAYNDNGELGGFGEMECNGQTIGGVTGRSKSIDQFIFWLFVGPGHQIYKIANLLLGINIGA